MAYTPLPMNIPHSGNFTFVPRISVSFNVFLDRARGLARYNAAGALLPCRAAVSAAVSTASHPLRAKRLARYNAAGALLPCRAAVSAAASAASHSVSREGTRALQPGGRFSCNQARGLTPSYFLKVRDK